MALMKHPKLSTLLVLYISFVFIQSLFFKFTDSVETHHIFTTLNNWSYDQFGIKYLFLSPGIFNAYVIGTAELIASILMLTGLFSPYKKLIIIGAFMALGIISGAIFFHLFTPLGVEVMGDGGTLFYMACGVWISSLLILYLNRNILFSLIKRD